MAVPNNAPKPRGGGRGFSSGETIAKEKRRPILIRLAKYMMRHKWLFLIAIILTLASNTFALLGPELAGKAINAIGLGEGSQFSYSTAISLMQTLIGFCMVWLTNKLSQKTTEYSLW